MQAISRLRIEDTMKGLPVTRGFGFGIDMVSVAEPNCQCFGCRKWSERDK
jgi:hypothetical protein